MRVASLLFSFVVFTGFLAAPLSAQDNLRAQLFGEADQAMSRAKEHKADFYAPASYGKATEYYSDADDQYKRGGKIEDIRDKLKNAAAYFVKATETSKTAEVAFLTTITARSDADKASSSKYVPEVWQKAEDLFRKAAVDLEQGNTDRSKEEAADAASSYRDSELQAIQANFLTPARQLLAKDDELNVGDEAPQTLAKARRIVAAVEQLLKQNRYDRDSARILAEQAKIEAGHALYLAQTIRELKKGDKTFEDVYLNAEAALQKVMSALGIVSRFDNGFDGPVSDAIAAVGQRQTEAARNADSLRQQGDIIRQRQIEIDNLHQQITSMEGRLGSLTDAEKDLQNKLTEQHVQEDAIHQVSSMFTLDEGKVLRDGNDIIIRLYGLTFPVGKSEIESEYYPLLSKVQDAVRKFPKSQVRIEGHTDSQGSDDVNQTLSSARAKAVAEYLMANMNVEVPIQSQGYGESRPVASNDTPEGRARNRRIDVVITPGWAVGGK